MNKNIIKGDSSLIVRKIFSSIIVILYTLASILIIGTFVVKCLSPFIGESVWLNLLIFYEMFISSAAVFLNWFEYKDFHSPKMRRGRLAMISSLHFTIAILVSFGFVLGICRVIENFPERATIVIGIFIFYAILYLLARQLKKNWGE
jgi:hypothetical protein